MKTDNSLKEIKKFWLWFEKNNALFIKVLEDGSNLKQKELSNFFDEKILSFGHFTWEISEGNLKKYQFVISPNREFELLQIAKKIISKAPEMPYWEFAYAREKVRYMEPFKIYDQNLDVYIIEPKDWSYKKDGKSFLMYAPNLEKLDLETEQHALDLVATAVLGEENRILNITELVKVDKTDESFYTL